MKNPFEGLYALSEAAKIWGMDDSTLRHAIKNDKFTDGIDIKKFGKQWVITHKAMEREYGKQKKAGE